MALAAVGGLIAIKTSINATRVLGGYAGKYFPKKSLQSVLKAVGIKNISIIALETVASILVICLDPIGMLMNWIDGLDGKQDGWIGKKGWFNW